MSRLGRAPQRLGATAVLLLAGLLVASLLPTPLSVGLSGPTVPSSPARAGPGPPGPLAAPSSLGSVPVVILPGNTTYWNGSGVGELRLQQGNVTIEPGGTLVIQNVTVSMVQFVTSTGTLAERLANVSTFLDEGSLILRHAVLTTDASVADAYLKLNMTVTGTLSLWESSLEFPGWMTLENSATATLNQSTVRSNPDAGATGLGATIVGDTSYAPSISVTTGSHLILLNSTLADTYADNTSANGIPGALPLDDNETVSISPTTNVALRGFQSETQVESLIQDWLYPRSYPVVKLLIHYSMSSGIVSSEVNLTFAGTMAPVAAVTFHPGVNQTVTLILPTILQTAINHAGPAGFMDSTGSFDHGTPYLSVGFGATLFGNSTATIDQTQVVALPALNFNVTCAGSGSSITAADSSLALTWARVPGSPTSTMFPFPWTSNKLSVTGGAQALLANISIPAPLPDAGAVTAVWADSQSTVFTYRWTDYAVSGPAGPIPQARVFAFAASSGPANATTNSLNAIPTASPALWSYVQWRDGQLGLPGYGLTGASGPVAGRAYLLLAASNLTGATTANASFVGEYHVGIVPPISGVPSQWFTFNVTPYPQNLTNATPDQGPSAYFSQYSAALVVVGISYSASGSPPTNQVRIGQLLGVEVQVRNIGATAVFNESGTLWYVPPGRLALIPIAIFPLTFQRIAPGADGNLTFSWLVNESVVGDHGTISASVNVTAQWNGGPPLVNGGGVNATQGLQVDPSLVTIVSLTSPAHSLSSSARYISAGTVVFNGSGLASVNLTATPVGGGSPVLLATNLSLNGSFELVYSDLGRSLDAGVAYLLQAVASYNGELSNLYTLPGNYTLAVPSASPPGFAIPWWVWLIVATGAIVAVALFLIRRRKGSPQLECGECASLVPLDAPTCPACGIYFESGEGRCARCGGPIPAGELACPECGYLPADRPGPPGAEEDRQAYRHHTEEFRAAAQGEIGDDYPEVEFWKWWRRQPSYQSFRDWKSGQTPARRNADDPDADPLGLGDGR